MTPISFSDFESDRAKSIMLPSYSQIRPHLIQPAKDVINKSAPVVRGRDGPRILLFYYYYT